MVALQIALLLVVVIALAYWNVPVIVWTVVIAVLLIGLTVLSSLGFIFLTVAWLIYLVFAAFANLTTLRQRYFTTPLIQKIEHRMPPISHTERDAIEAGNIWWEKELFRGRPNWKTLFAIPQPQLSDEEQHFLDHQVETLCNMLDDWQIVFKDHDLSPDVWDYLKKERFLGMIIPKEYGGLGFSALAHSTIVLKIASRSASAAVDMMVPNSLGPGELLQHYGTEEQKNYYLPRLAVGEEIPCFALTAPEAGSDAASITDSGIVCYGEFAGQNVLGIRLTWDKRYITLAPIATVLGLAFRLFDPEHLLGDQDEIGITLCLVPTALPGVEIGSRHLPMHMAFMNGPTRGQDVFIPMNAIIGGVEMAGKGWRMLMESLSIGRSISLPALSTAAGKLIYLSTSAYAGLRKQFNVPIAQFEGVEEALGYIAVYTYILEACRIMTAGAIDLNIRPAIASAIAKYHMTEMSRKIVAHAMDIQAGHAIQVGPRNVLAHAHMANPVSITVEGANILTRNLIIFGQGAIRCHPYILAEVDLFAQPKTTDRTQKLDKILLSHIGYAVSNAVRSLWMGLTGGFLLFSPVRGKTASHYRQLTRMSAALALLSDMAMLTLGGNLKRKERISARLGDILSQLYLASTVLKNFQDQGQPIADLDYIKCAIEMCLYKIQIACNELEHNFPHRIVAKIVYTLIFPWGPAYKKPHDNLFHRIVNSMFDSPELRERITRYCFISKDANDPVRRMENALLKVKEIDPIWKKFQIATRNGTVTRLGSLQDRIEAAVNAKILTNDEMLLLLDFNDLYQEIIQVNEFSFDLSSVVK